MFVNLFSFFRAPSWPTFEILRGLYHIGMASLRAAFALEGHATVRNALRPAACRALRSEALASLSALSLRCGRLPRLHQLRYEAVRHGWLESGVRPSPTADLSKVYSPYGRHVILPPESTSLSEALLALARASLQMGLPPSAGLVELSVAITLPSAFAQDPHTDISPATLDHRVADGSRCAPLVTCWMALQPVVALQPVAWARPSSR